MLESDGRPNSGLAAIIFPEPPEQPISRMFDNEGWVEFTADGSQRTLVIERRSAVPFRTTFDLVPGSFSIRLPELTGSTFEGHVLVNSAPPLSPLSLALDSRASDDLIDFTDRPYFAARGVTFGSTDNHGRFCFRGLTADRPFSITVPVGYAFSDESGTSEETYPRTVHFSGGQKYALLELKRLAIIRGRILESSGVPPAEGAMVSITINGSLNGIATDLNGYFELAVQDPPVKLLCAYERYRPNASCAHIAMGYANRAEFRFPTPSFDTDLGSLILSPSDSLVLEIRDDAGQPIANAETGVSRPTDSSGRAFIEGISAGSEITVTHRNYKTCFVAVPNPAPDTISVSMVPTNDLTVQLRTADGTPCLGATLELAASECFLPTEAPSYWENAPSNSGLWWSSWPRHHAYEGRRGSVWLGETYRARFEADSNGRMSVGELAPGIPIHLTILDQADCVLHQLTISPLGATEVRTLTVQLDAELRRLGGRVVTESDQAISGANVTISCGDAQQGTTVSTGSDGRFEFSSVSTGHLELAVAKPGFLPLTLDTLLLNALQPSEDLRCVLMEGASVTVRIVWLEADIQTRAHDTNTAVVRARSVGGKGCVTADMLQNGNFKLLGLSAVPHEVELDLGSCLMRKTWTPFEGEVVFDLSELIGIVEALWRISPTSVEAQYCIRVESPTDQDGRDFPIVMTPVGMMAIRLPVGEHTIVLVATSGAGPVELERHTLRVTPGNATRVTFGL